MGPARSASQSAFHRPSLVTYRRQLFRLTVRRSRAAVDRRLGRVVDHMARPCEGPHAAGIRREPVSAFSGLLLFRRDGVLRLQAELRRRQNDGPRALRRSRAVLRQGEVARADQRGRRDRTGSVAVRLSASHRPLLQRRVLPGIRRATQARRTVRGSSPGCRGGVSAGDRGKHPAVVPGARKEDRHAQPRARRWRVAEQRRERARDARNPVQEHLCDAGRGRQRHLHRRGVLPVQRPAEGREALSP